ncbi:hemerythrin [Aliarcobacter faecis]|uniref:hemerythrin family protein n=1 Tax=Aliarcobacter faecis TaxID=1564138 RepID=UPI00047B2E4D|nr:hemerythrin family protein [Aliarcobacter faecis]QKF74441.1 hemerythrin [Aliarcobacter faecis]
MLIDKNNLPLVDAEFMNNTHFEDVDLINKIYENIEIFEKNNSNENFENLKSIYEEWINHTVKHFLTEEEEMQKRGFFAYPFHKGEHDRNIEDIKAVWIDFEENRDIEALKNYIEYDLINWLVNHIRSMDTVTARFFNTGMSPCSMM